MFTKIACLLAAVAVLVPVAMIHLHAASQMVA